MELSSPEWYENEVLVHRYLYYVLNEPIISDFEYDLIEREARAICPVDSVVQGIGSSLASSYSLDIAMDAASRLENISFLGGKLKW